MHPQRYIYTLICTLWIGLLVSLSIPMRLQISLEVSSGAHLSSLGRVLRVHGIIPYGIVWGLYLSGHEKHLQPGVYTIQPNMSYFDLFKMLYVGQVAQYTFTIVEGWHAPHLRKAMADDLYLKDCASMKLPDYLMPDTYKYRLQGNPCAQILDLASDAYASWAQGKKNPKKTYIMASIIEKESHYQPEQAEIAGVLYRRLKKRIPLQVDASVRYALDKYHGRVSYTDTKSASNFNLYTHRGLPPLPISYPGISALEAAASPIDRGFLYFVSDGCGRHIFSKTLDEHIRHVHHYRKIRKAMNRGHNLCLTS